MSGIRFERIAANALRHGLTLIRRWLPNGRRVGTEWIALNPTRVDHHRGSFKVNLTTGRWADFATGDSGGDLISLAAYLFDLDQVSAAIRVAGALGIDPYE